MLRAVVLVFTLLLGACSAPPVVPVSEEPEAGTPVPQPTPSAPSPSPSAPTEWREPATYSFTLESRCGFRMLIGRFHVEVENGAVVSVDGLDEQGRLVAGIIQHDEVPTLTGLLGRVAEARNEGADEVNLSTDPVDGRPISIEIDWQANAIDDEECYTISDFAPAGG